MAGDWIKIEHTLPDKPEVIRMSTALGVDQDAVAGKLLRVWIWADQNSVDGNDVTVTNEFLDRKTSCPGFAKAMRDVGWLEGRDGALTFPRFDRHNGQSSKARVLTNIRVAQHRQRRNGNVTPEPLPKPLPEKRREEKSNTPIIPPSNFKPPTLEEAVKLAAGMGVGVPEDFARKVWHEHDGTDWSWYGKPITNWRSYIKMRFTDHQSRVSERRTNYQHTRAADGARTETPRRAGGEIEPLGDAR